MVLSEYLLFAVAVATSVVGIIFLLFPGKVAKLEHWLNTSCGKREIAAIRLGLPGEQRIEQVLNRRVLDKRIIWDQWTHNHPHLTGTLLCLIAGILLWVTMAA